MPQINTQIKDQILVQRRAQAVSTTKQGKLVIVLGAMPTNLPPGLRDHPFVELWQSDTHLPKSLPDNAGMVLHTRFCGHDDLQRLREDAHRKNIEFWPVPFTTGDLAMILEPLAPAPIPPREQHDTLADPSKPIVLMKNGVVVDKRGGTPAAPEATVAAPAEEGHVGRGVLKEFILKHGNLSAANYAIEAKRLFDIAKKSGESIRFTTEGSLAQGLYAMRSALGVSREGKQRRPRAAGNGKVAPAPAVAVKPRVTEHVSADEGDEVLKLARDAVAAIQLLAERYKEIRARHAATAGIKDKLMAELANL